MSESDRSLERAIPAATALEPAIALAGVSKVFARTEQRAETLKESLLEAPVRRRRVQRIQALRDVSFTVRRGEALAIIGANGAGKTTLLKLIAGITHPTAGEVRVRGRVLGLIELGAGFHPDLTGVENIRLQGAIYGLPGASVEARIPSILQFAELTDFAHLPVRHYSSGMFVRLGFSVAVHAEPDVLLVDEVLAVGDQRFQERSLAKIRELRARGATLLFVTHAPELAERICDRAMWLDAGRVRALGPAPDVLAAYHRDLIERRYCDSQGPLTPEAIAVGLPGRFGTGEARIERVRLLDGDGRPKTNFRPGESIRIEIDYRAQPQVQAVDCTIPLDSLDGTILTLWRAQRQAGLGRPREGRGRFTIDVDRPPLRPGRYRLTIALSPPDRPSDHYDVLYKLMHFTVDHDATDDGPAPIELPSVVERERDAAS